MTYPSYAILDDEIWWRDETVSPAMDALGDRMRSHWGVGPSVIGSKGDNRHLKGRHRSRDWTRNSEFCTNRSYADSALRDRMTPDSDGKYLRAYDIEGMPRVERIAFNHRLDEAVRTSRLSIVAEWWGTLDGSTVAGWFQGKPDASADSSHLDHTHIGLWTDSVHNAAQLDLLGDILIGVDDMALTDAQLLQLLADTHLVARILDKGDRGDLADTAGGGIPNAWIERTLVQLSADVAAIRAKVDSLQASPPSGEAFAEAVAAKVDQLIAGRYAA